MGKNGKNRIVYLEIIRIISLFCIMWNHSYEVGFHLFQVNQQSRFYLVYVALSIMCKVGAPLFFMVSGVVLLDREESMKEIFYKRILRILLVMCIYTLGYMFYFDCDLRLFPKLLLQGKITEGAWYLYSYLVFLLLLPILRRWVQSMENWHFLWLFLLAAASYGISPIINFLWGIQVSDSFDLVKILQWDVLYPMLGYYFGCRLKKQELGVKTMGLSLAIGGGALLTGSLLMAKRYMAEQVFEDGMFHRNFLPILTVSVFLLVRYLVDRIEVSPHIQAFWTEIGKCTFGVYLLERILRDKTAILFEKFLYIGISQLLASYCWIFCAMVLGIVLVWGIRKVPLIRRIL